MASKNETKNGKTGKSMRKYKRKYRRIKKFFITVVVIILAILGFYFGKDALTRPGPTVEPVSGNEVQFHFIDVGQGDAAVISTYDGKRACSMSKISQAWLRLAPPLFIAALTLTLFLSI